MGLILDRTAFYAEAGGQTCDVGSLLTAEGGVEVRGCMNAAPASHPLLLLPPSSSLLGRVVLPSWKEGSRRLGFRDWETEAAKQLAPKIEKGVDKRQEGGPGGTQEATRMQPGRTQEAPRRHIGSTQEAPKAPESI